LFKKLSTLVLVVLLVLSLTASVFAEEETKTIKFGINCDSLPFAWEQDKDDNSKLVQISDSDKYAYGYDVIIASRLANKCGFQLELINLDADEGLTALKDGQVDVLMSGFDLSSTGDLIFSKPYYYNNVVTLVKSGSAFSTAASVSDLTGAKVFADAAVSDRASEIKDATVMEYAEMSDMLEALVSGECDAAIVNRTYAKAAILEYKELSALDFYGTDGDYSSSADEVEICITATKENSALIELFDIEIEKLSLGMNKEFTFKNFDSSMHAAITLNPDFIYAEAEGTSFIDNIVKLIERFGMTYLTGAGTTLLISIVGTFFGCVIGFIVGIIQTIPTDKKRDSLLKRGFLAVVRAILRAYVEVFRGTPMIVQAVFIYYGARMVFGIQMGMWTAAFFIVSINTGAYMAETVRGGIMSIDIGQTEGAKAIGMNHVQTMLHVILPQTFRVIIPQIGNNYIINIKDTSVLSVISISDLFFTHKAAAGALYTFFESATIVMAIYLTMTMVTSVLLRKLEKALGDTGHYDLATKDTLALTSGTYNFPEKKKKLEDFK